MFKLNKILSLSLASIALLLTGCGSDDESGNASIDDNNSNGNSTSLVAYSSQLSASSEVASCARILIPKESATTTRALRMLEEQGLLQLEDNGGELSVQNITSNPYYLDILIYEPTQIATVISDTNVAIFVVDPTVISSTIPANKLFVEVEEDA
ncbi:MetQ/NlpA family ABC transporter substrate-binding protein [Vibrio ziniensis]|uniref:Lipoprotein n=1 Tax=Vibrio ziniensis TaxID=2711221 RepID=A0A6G7CGS8_9VIBR|nr:MetQ/NlpA family ABC transporter substrate-binding protein [Vibrio ziniensis]QIH41280.1 hypothetical protein G5S32_04440 [Vibrio ziniensis]